MLPSTRENKTKYAYLYHSVLEYIQENKSMILEGFFHFRLKNYRDLLNEFQKRIDTIYFAYLYAIGNSNPRTEIDDLRKVKQVFSNIQQVEFKSALEGSLQDKKDGVLILKRGGK